MAHSLPWIRNNCEPRQGFISSLAVQVVGKPSKGDSIFSHCDYLKTEYAKPSCPGHPAGYSSYKSHLTYKHICCTFRQNPPKCGPRKGRWPCRGAGYNRERYCHTARPIYELCTLQLGLTLTDSKDGGLQRRLTDSLKRYTSFISSPRTLSSHRKSDAGKKLVQRSRNCH